MVNEYEGPRGIRKEELADLHALWDVCFPGPAFNLNIGDRLFEDDNLENLRVFVHQGRPVSHVGVLIFDLMLCSCQVKVACIGGVCTHGDHRGKRLAGRLLEDAWRKMREDGVDFAMISGDRSLYWRAGCAACRPTYTYEVPPAGENAAQVTAGDARLYLEDMCRIYQTEPIHFCRSMEDLQSITHPWELHKDKVVFALLGKSAYVMGWRWQTEKENFCEVLEYAGDRKLLAERAPALADRFGAPLRFHVPAWDEELRTGLARAGKQTHYSNCWGGTIKILALDRMMEKLRPMWGPRAGKELMEKISFSQSDDTAEIALGKETFTLEGKELAELVFGTVEERAWAPDKPALRDVVRLIFPLPGPQYGLNFI